MEKLVALSYWPYLALLPRLTESAPGNGVRIVTENARTLKFSAQGIEPE